jgi:shikimate kinase
MRADCHPIVLIGPMGAGKTAIGGLLAAGLGLPFVDSDASILAELGETGAVIAARRGVEELHRIELAVCSEVLGRAEPLVFAAAESVVESEDARAQLRDAFTVWVDADPIVLMGRRDPADHRRLMDEAEFAERRASRDALLASCTRVRVDTTEGNVEDAVRAILDCLA